MVKQLLGIESLRAITYTARQMSVEFSLSDFLLPGALWEFRRLYSRLWTAPPEEVALTQNTLLQKSLEHAVRHVPHYAQMFSKLGLSPSDIKSPGELVKLPVLTRAEVADNPRALQADNAAAYHPRSFHTSGTSGRRLDFLLDRRTNAQEFAYYWRYWNKAGYRLGDPFVEFSTTYFLKKSPQERIKKQKGTGRMLLNSLYLDSASVRSLVDEVVRHRARFMKGLPSVIAAFSVLAQETRLSLPPLKAIFSTGEMLTDPQRKLIESVWGCKVVDSYGHMERVVAASECPAGRLHINMDYGLLEVENGRILATSLHNRSMPLIRYDTGDTAEVDPYSGPCACGSYFPALQRVMGRQEDVVVTPDGRVIPTLYLVFDDFPEIQGGQIVQEKPDFLRVRVCPRPGYNSQTEDRLFTNIRRFTGSSVKIEVEKVRLEDLWVPGRKFKVVSRP